MVRIQKLIWIAITIIGTSSLAWPAVPQTMTQQGRLLNADGTPVSAQITMTFAIYDSADATGALWTESQAITPDSNGYFSLQLGAVAAFPSSPAVWDGSTRYLGVKINTDPEMTPREQITSVPYALVANDAVGDIHPTSVTVAGTQVVSPTATLNPSTIAPGALTAAQLATGTLTFTPSVTVATRNGMSAGAIGPGLKAYAYAYCQAGEQLVGAFCNPFNTGMDVYTAGIAPTASPPYVSCGCNNITSTAASCSAVAFCMSVAQTAIP